MHPQVWTVDAVFLHGDRPDAKMERPHRFKKSIPNFIPALIEFEFGPDV
jgi:hypothetical protein